jgi:hypothetical protein
MPAASYLIEAWRLIAEMIDRVGIAIVDSSHAVKLLVARKIIHVDADLYNSVQSARDIPRLKLLLWDLEQTLLEFRDDRRDDVGDGAGPYPIEGIAFRVLVHLVRLEDCALYWGWTPEQLRELVLDVRRDEEIIWLCAEYVELRDSSGRVRRRYRLQ